jgi:carboxyl-terminal processing protease
MTRAVAHLNRHRWPYGLALIGLAMAAGLLIRESVVAQVTAPQPNDRYVAMTVANKLLEEHLTRHPLDTEVSQRCFKGFLKTLDAYKLYFTQADIDQFKPYENQLAEKCRKGDIGFAYLAFQTFLKRVDERIKMVDGMLDPAHKFDFTVDESIITDPDKTTYAKTTEEMQDKWNKRIKYDLLTKESEDKIEEPEAREKLKTHYHGFAKRMHQISGDELLEMYLTALTTSFDPHTSYMSASTEKNFEIIMKAELDGIGASLQDKDGSTIVNELIDGGAAQLDGRLKPKDRVVGVGQGENGEVVDTVEMGLSDVVNLIRGKRGTIVRLKVIPAGQTESKIYNITRAKIELKNSEARSEIVEDGKKPDGKPYKVGFIDLPGFYMDMTGARQGLADFKSATRDVRKILDDFNEKHVDVCVIDLRRNGGGALNEAISLTGLFVGSGPVVQVKDHDGDVKQYNDPDPTIAWRGPLVVLQSKFSASASEIFAGAIQDYHRGLIIGDHASHGKGTVQSMLDVGQSLFLIPNAPSLGALKITIQQFYRPDGDSTQRRGVESDVELPALTTHLPVGEADLDFALKFDHVNPAAYKTDGMVDPALVKKLQELSAARVAKSADFQKVEKNTERYEKQKENKTVSLNKVKFLAERADLNPDKEEEKEYDELNESKRPVVKLDYYIKEVMNVAIDYLRLSPVKELALSN